MIYKDKHLIFAIFLIMIPCFENFDNSQKFTIIDLITSFYRNYYFKKKAIGYY